MNTTFSGSQKFAENMSEGNCACFVSGDIREKIKFTFKLIFSILPFLSKKIRYENEKKLDRYLYNKDPETIQTAKAIQNNYLNLLNKMKEKVKNKEKIKVVFYVISSPRWSFKSLFREFEKSPYFEPIILLSKLNVTRRITAEEAEKILRQNIEFYSKLNIKFELAYDLEQKKYLPLDKFQPDIIFYQQPWSHNDSHNIFQSSAFSLACYVPYCFYMLESDYNYMDSFHAHLWRYFTENDIYTRQYEKKFRAKNCITTGNTKLDNYKLIDSDIKTKNAKTVIYAPHHMFKTGHLVGTFEQTGKFILNLAKKHKEIHWIFKPHVSFFPALVNDGIMSREEAENYRREWENLENATVSSNDCYYYELFMESDALITDSISFLAEYLPSKNPVIMLKSKKQRENFSELGKLITKHYYKTYNNKELENTFNRVVLKDDDYLKEERTGCIKYLNIDETRTNASKIVEYLKREFEINEE